MFEEYTFETILSSMMARVPNTLDKRQGSIIYNALAPIAVELQNMYINLDVILNETFPDTASREYLIRRAQERGLSPYLATYAIVKAVTTPSTLELNIGERFSLDRLNYVVTEKIDAGNYKLQCESLGSAANFQFGQLIPINYIQGLEYAEITEILIPGEDEESTEDFRKRYFKSVNQEAFGGNIADYKQKTNALSGVGGVKVIPTWNGGGTVKLVILNSSFGKPSSDLINYVQTAIDPVTNQGEGLGIAPIGHVVTVVGVDNEILNLTANFTFETGYDWSEVETSVINTVNNYFLELNQDWENQANIIVRISQIETRILNISGIIDIQNVTINGETSNYTVGANNIPVLGTITPV